MKYDKAVHKREDVDSSFVQRTLFDNPVYDPFNEREASVPCYPEMVGIDGHRDTEDKGLFPGYGGFHMHHRIDGKLVAIGNLDLCRKSMNSAYFIYDPDLKHLNLGIVGAIIEIEYMRMLNEKFDQ